MGSAGEVFTLRFGEKTARVYVENKLDAVQTYHRWGIFYESNQLQQHADLVFHGSTVIDVGTNVGNHAVFYASCTYAAAIYLFEPNVRARNILDRTLALNNFSDRVRLDYYTCAVGAEDGHVSIAQEYENNLGATHFSRSSTCNADQIKCVALDSLTFKGDISLIKIDVEGMEIGVLTGAEATIQQHRPALAVEVNSINHAKFWQWLRDHDYHVINMYHESKGVRNYIAVPGG